MATRVQRGKKQPLSETTYPIFVRYFPTGLMAAIILFLVTPTLLDTAGNFLGGIPRFFKQITGGHTVIAPLFTPTVQYWAGDIERWADEHEVDPNLLATVMQIESCGHPTVGSSAGAQGLFQVMPFHFAEGEVYLDPDTNALRSANFLKECTRYAKGDIGLTLACYNGGPSVTRKFVWEWPNETQRYYKWGLGIYNDAVAYSGESQTLTEWLNAGGTNLCQRASTELGIQ